MYPINSRSNPSPDFKPFAPPIIPPPLEVIPDDPSDPSQKIKTCQPKFERLKDRVKKVKREQAEGSNPQQQLGSGGLSRPPPLPIPRPIASISPIYFSTPVELNFPPIQTSSQPSTQLVQQPLANGIGGPLVQTPARAVPVASEADVQPMVVDLAPPQPANKRRKRSESESLLADVKSLPFPKKAKWEKPLNPQALGK